MKLELQSEVYGPLGNITGRGVTRALGRPHLSPLEVLVRESIQNSLDARLPAGKEVEYHIDVTTRTGSELKAIRQAFTASKGHEFLPFDHLFEGERFDTLLICDRGTRGLDGPTRADEAIDGDQRNFVDFFRNVGEAPDAVGTGGTYGYGKAALYIASMMRTILVFTRARSGRNVVARLMGMTLHDASGFRTSDRARLTGRHWWGKRGAGGVVDPIEGSEAETFAESLGFHAFGKTTGTQIMILAPILGDSDSESKVHHLLEHALLYAWPWTCGMGNDDTTLVLSGTADGADVASPRVEDFATLTEMRDALRAVVANREEVRSSRSALIEIVSQRPQKRLGGLGLRRYYRAERLGMPSAFFKQDETVASQHVAWLRGARLVVRYWKGPESTTTDVEYAGVFLASEDDDVERAFSDSEPPTHDDWLPEFVSAPRHQSYVRIALRRLKQAVEEFVLPARSVGADQRTGVAAWISTGLAALLPGAVGERPGPSTIGGGGGVVQPPGGHLHNPLTLTGAQRWEKGADGVPMVAVEYKISSRVRQPVTVIARAPVVVGDGAEIERDAPAGASDASILGWRVEGALTRGQSIAIRPGDRESVWLLVSVPKDAVVTPVLHVEPLQ